MEQPIPLQSELEIVESRTALYSGPLPPPKMLADYDQIVLGSAERIIAMAENSLSHRYSLAKDQSKLQSDRLRANFSLEMTGKIFGFIGFLICVGLAGYFAKENMKWAAGIFLAAPVLATIAMFVGSRNENSNKSRNAETDD